MLSEEPSTWSVFSPSSPATLGFLTGCINHSLQLEGPSSTLSTHSSEPLIEAPYAAPPLVDPNPSSSRALPLGCFSYVPPLSEAIPNPSPSFEVQDSMRVFEPPNIPVTQPQKKQKCFKSRVADIPPLVGQSFMSCSLPLPPPTYTSSFPSTIQIPSYPPPSPSVNSTSWYPTRSKTKGRGPDAVSLDVDVTRVSLKPSKGRPSILSKEIAQAGEEVDQGKQRTIDSILRAKDALPPRLP